MKKLQTNEINLNQVVALTVEQAKARYNIGSNSLYGVAEKAEAVIHIGSKKKLYSRSKLDIYFEELTTVF